MQFSMFPIMLCCLNSNRKLDVRMAVDRGLQTSQCPTIPRGQGHTRKQVRIKSFAVELLNLLRLHSRAYLRRSCQMRPR
jgi:hypothetical protein